MIIFWVRWLQLLIWASQFQLSFCGQLPLTIYNDVPASVIESSKLLSLHKHLVEIESITGNEKEVGKQLASYLQDHGLTVEKQEVAKDRFNVLAYPGNNSNTKLLVTSHIDTV
jgi:acetylornithine deacetylase